MEEHQNKQPAVVEQAGSQEQLCHIWDLTLASTVDILSKWQDQPQWMKKKNSSEHAKFLFMPP